MGLDWMPTAVMCIAFPGPLPVVHTYLEPRVRALAQQRYHRVHVASRRSAGQPARRHGVSACDDPQVRSRKKSNRVKKRLEQRGSSTSSNPSKHPLDVLQTFVQEAFPVGVTSANSVEKAPLSARADFLSKLVPSFLISVAEAAPRKSASC